MAEKDSGRTKQKLRDQAEAKKKEVLDKKKVEPIE